MPDSARLLDLGLLIGHHRRKISIRDLDPQPHRLPCRPFPELRAAGDVHCPTELLRRNPQSGLQAVGGLVVHHKARPDVGELLPSIQAPVDHALPTMIDLGLQRGHGELAQGVKLFLLDAVLGFVLAALFAVA